MDVRFYRLKTRSKIGVIALGALAVVIGGVFLIFGLTLLIGLSLLGIVLAVSARIYRKLTGRSPFPWKGAVGQHRASSLEVFSPEDQKLLSRNQDQQER